MTGKAQDLLGSAIGALILLIPLGAVLVYGATLTTGIGGTDVAEELLFIFGLGLVAGIAFFLLAILWPLSLLIFIPAYVETLRFDVGRCGGDATVFLPHSPTFSLLIPGAVYGPVLSIMLIRARTKEAVPRTIRLAGMSLGVTMLVCVPILFSLNWQVSRLLEAGCATFK